MKRIMTSLKLFFTTLSLFLLPRISCAEENTCPTFMEYISEGTGNNFLLNPAFEVITKAAASVAEASWNLFATPLQVVVMFGAAIYIAVYTLRNIGSFSQQDYSSYLSNEKTGVIPLMFKVAVVMILLTNAGNSFLYSNFISPVVSTCMLVGAKFGSSPVGGSFSNASNVSSLFNSILELIRSFNDISYEIVALGRELLCLSFMPDSFIDKFWGMVPFGIILYLFGWLICIGLAFYMLDVLFRLAVGCIVLPFAIACAVSKLTVTYTQKTWALFVNVCFNFMVMGIITNFSVEMLAKAVGGHNDLKSKLTGSALKESEVEKIYEDLSLKGFILTFICCLIVFRLFAEIENLASRISGAKGVGQLAQKASSPFIKSTYNGAKRATSGFFKSTTKKAASKAKNLLGI